MLSILILYSIDHTNPVYKLVHLQNIKHKANSMIVPLPGHNPESISFRSYV